MGIRRLTAMAAALAFAAASCGCRTPPKLVDSPSARISPPLAAVASPPADAPRRGPESDASRPEDNSADPDPGSATSQFDWQGLDTALPEKDGEADAEIDQRQWPPVYFSYNQSHIGATEEKKLEALCDYLAKNKKLHVVAEGHCDERGSDEYNRALGERRALAVREFMVGRKLAAARIATLSYGEEKPAAKGRTELAFSQNRRAEFVVYLPASGKQH